MLTIRIIRYHYRARMFTILKEKKIAGLIAKQQQQKNTKKTHTQKQHNPNPPHLNMTA